MKKGQSGVSLIALVITIIVVIILAAIAFGTSTRTITNANYSTFTNAVGEVRTALQERVTTVKGEEAAKGRTRTDAQVYNFVAKGAELNKTGQKYAATYNAETDNSSAWLSRAQANLLDATRIEPEVISDVLNLKNLNDVKVNTTKGSGIQVSYYVTRNGDVFVWPPYEYEGKYYVNDNKNITVTNDTDTTIDMKDGLTIDIVNSSANDAKTTPAAPAGNAASVTAGTTTVYWYDRAGANSPRGIESNGLFNDGSNNN